MDDYTGQNWLVHVSNNQENDRVDEGDFLSNDKFHLELSSPLDEENSVYDVFQGDYLVAKVRGRTPDSRLIIPLRDLSDDDEDKLYQYLDGEELFS